MQQSTQSIKEFINLSKGKTMSIHRVEWWLLKYSDLYKKTYDFVYSQHLYIDDDGAVIRLPPFGKPTDLDKFLNLYEALDKISKFHRNEKYFKQELTEYEK